MHDVSVLERESAASYLHLDKIHLLQSCRFRDLQVTPVGIAIGMGISKTYNENSKLALGFKGGFNSISAGMISPPMEADMTTQAQPQLIVVENDTR